MQYKYFHCLGIGNKNYSLKAVLTKFYFITVSQYDQWKKKYIFANVKNNHPEKDDWWVITNLKWNIAFQEKRRDSRKTLNWIYMLMYNPIAIFLI